MNIRLGGVDEHYNLPVHLAIESRAFERAGLSVEWTTYHGGTGAMANALEEDRVDACIVLTEGIVAAIAKGLKARIVGAYTVTPLIWGVHTASDSSLENYDASFDRLYAISRWGSGSHLIPVVDARAKGKVIRPEQFVVVGNLEGALASLAAHDTDVFYWEKFTTKPYVDNGQLRRIGEFPTPWPAWMIAVTESTWQRSPEVLEGMLRIVRESSKQLMNNSQAPVLVARRYGIVESDAEEWLRSTRWSLTGMVHQGTIMKVGDALKEAGAITGTDPLRNIISLL